MKLFNIFKNKESKDIVENKITSKNKKIVKQKKSSKRKTLVKEFEEIVERGNEEEIKEVFKKCNINAYETGVHKMNALGFNLSEDMMSWLIENGADIEYEDYFGCTPLAIHAGRINGHLEYLIKLGANIESRDHEKNTPLFHATRLYYINNVKILVEAGANVNVKNSSGETPLLNALKRARNGDLPELVELVKYLLKHKARLTGKEKDEVKRIGEEFEWFRDDINKDYIDELDNSLTELYTIFKVKPVPRRVLYDEKSNIIVKSKTWQKQNEELWNLLVPSVGVASTVQGEVIRVCGRLSHEILDNGKINWSRDFLKMVRTLLKYIMQGNLLSDEENTEIHNIINDTSHLWEDELNRLTELCVKWVLLNPKPIILEKVDYNH